MLITPQIMSIQQIAFELSFTIAVIYTWKQRNTDWQGFTRRRGEDSYHHVGGVGGVDGDALCEEDAHLLR